MPPLFILKKCDFHDLTAGAKNGKISIYYIILTRII